MRRLVPVFLLLSLFVLATTAIASDEKAADLTFTVVKNDTGKPVKNASVILHSVNKKGKQDKGGLQLKTDADGKASYAGVPYGKLRVQVIAPGFQTFGEDYEVAEPNQAITIKLKRPQEQYSIYK
jgi:5-hydroxyisourate hydrolase-like protein (transthyretin family)